MATSNEEIVEFAEERILQSRGTAAVDAWIVLVVDDDEDVHAATRLALLSCYILGLSFIREALYGHPIADIISVGGESFHIASARSELLGWIFVAKVPAGLNDRRFQNLVGEILILAGGSLLFGLLIAFIWALRVGGAVKTLVSIAGAVSGRRPLGNESPGFIKEFDHLAEELRSLGKAVEEREGDLLKLNAGLEERIAVRTAELTRTNRELSETLKKLNGTQNELVQSQKLAALGQLVAGVAHELNTPLGNGLMAVSTISDRHVEFEREIEAGLRKSALTSYLADVKAGIDIALRNLRKAADLIGSFKQLAVDRTSDQRRSFPLSEVVRENLLALHPQFKRTRHTVSLDVPPNLRLDSYPGILGQVLTNLINNALIHAFDEGTAGSIRITAAGENDRVILEVADDGKGIPESARARASYRPQCGEKTARRHHRFYLGSGEGHPFYPRSSLRRTGPERLEAA